MKWKTNYFLGKEPTMSSTYSNIIGNPNGLAFYNGTSCPLQPQSDMHYPDVAQEMMVDGLKSGLTLKEQGDIYKEQMDVMESRLNIISDGKMVTQKHIDEWCEHNHLDEDTMMSLWYINVISLEKLKVIKTTQNFLLNL